MNERTIKRTGSLVFAQVALANQTLVCYSESANGTLEPETAFACYRLTDSGREYLDIVQSADTRLAYRITYGLFRSRVQEHLATS